jgi:hypothetical protein
VWILDKKSLTDQASRYGLISIKRPAAAMHNNLPAEFVVPGVNCMQLHLQSSCSVRC